MTYYSQFALMFPVELCRLARGVARMLRLAAHPDRDTVADWIERLLTCHHGRLVLYNLARELRHANLGAPAVRRGLFWEFFRGIGVSYAAPDERTDALAQGAQVVAGASLFLRGPAVTLPARLSRVVTTDRVPTLLSSVTGLSDWPEDLIRVIAAAPHGLELLRAVEVPVGVLPLAWVTQSKEIEETVSSHPEGTRASVLRDQLGLSSRYDGYHLLELRYPDGFAPPELRAPTVFDGIDSPYFRAVDATRTPDGFGRTVELRTFKDGLPEAVHRNCDLEPGFVVKYVGYTVVARPQIDEDRYEEQAQYLVREMWRC